jgi:hypothetical protein
MHTVTVWLYVMYVCIHIYVMYTYFRYVEHLYMIECVVSVILCVLLDST